MTFIANDVSYRYPGAESLALHEINCSLHTGEIIGLVGLSGSGKSTFGRLAKGLLEESQGCFSLIEADSRKTRLTSARRLLKIGWTEPHPERQFFAATVGEEVAFGPANLGLKDDELTERVDWALQLLDLDPANYKGRDPHSLSGGEKRRGALASIIAMRYPFYIFDEPTAGLDFKGRRNFRDLLERLKGEGCGVVWITHNIEQLAGVVDRVWGFESGRLALDVPSNEIDWSALLHLMEQGESLSTLCSS